MKQVAVLLLGVSLVACGAPNTSADRQMATRDHAYGVWSTERGQTIDVRRDGSFTYCDMDECASGRSIRSGVTHVFLIDFGRMPETKKLREASYFDLAPEDSDGLNGVVHRNGLDLGDGHMDEEYRRRLCQGRPCRIVGVADHEVYRLVKLKDY